MFQQVIGGLVSGGVYAGLAVCIVLMYRMLAVLNFAIAGIGALGSCVALALYTAGAPVVLAIIGGIAGGAIIAAVIGLVMARWFIDSTVEIRSTVTIGLLVTMIAVGDRILGGTAHNFPALFASSRVVIGGTGVPLASIIEVVGALVLAVAIREYLRRTRTGRQMRALSTRPTTAQLMGIPVRKLTVLVWAFAGAISTLALIFVLPTSTSNFGYLALLVVPSLAGALLALLESLIAAAIGGVLVGILQSLVLGSSTLGLYADIVPFVLIVIVMLWRTRRDVWAEAR